MWFILALASTLVFLIYDLLSRVLVVKSDDPRAFSALYNFAAGFFSLGLFLIDRFQWHKIPLSIWLLTVAMIVVYGIFNRTEYAAKKHIEASLFAVVGKGASVVAFFASIIFLSESVTWQKLVAAFLIFFANYMVIHRQKSGGFTKGLPYALVMIISLGIGWTIDKKASPYFPLPLYAFLGYTIANVFVIFFPTIPLRTYKKELQKAGWKLWVLSAVAAVGYYLLLKAFSYGEASKVILIFSTRTIVTIILAILLLKEKSDIPKKLFAGALTVIAVTLLG